jgi:hypothetical protein
VLTLFNRGNSLLFDNIMPYNQNTMSSWTSPYDRWPDSGMDMGHIDDSDTRIDPNDYGRDLQTMRLIDQDVMQRGTVSAAPHARQQSAPLPPGYEVQQVPISRRFAILDARDYTRISFGTLLTQDYGRLVKPSLPLGERDDSTDRQLRKLPSSDDCDSDCERGIQYASRLLRLPAPEAVKQGIEPDLIMTKRERRFCEEFLGFMAVLDHDGAEEFSLGTASRPGNPRLAAEWLLNKLRTVQWKTLNWNDRAREAVGDRPVSSGYRSFLGRVAAGETIDGEPEKIKAYPLQKLNPDTWLYLCEDGNVRARVDSKTLLPPPPPGFSNGPVASLSQEYDIEREVFARTVTHQLEHKDRGESRPFKWITHPARVLSYPPKQRLADIAGRALTRLSADAS